MRDMFRRTLLSPDGEGSGDQNQEPPKPPEAGGGEGKTFTQAQVDEFIKKRVKNHERDNKALQLQLKQTQDTLTQVQEQLKTLQQKSNEPPPPAPDDVQGQLTLMAERHRREVEGLTTQIETLKKQGEAEVRRRREVERDRELTESLTKAECTDLKVGKRLFAPQIIYDDVDDKWVFQLEKGSGIVSIEEGIEEELPDYLRKARSRGVGSGSSGNGSGGTRNLSTQARQLETEEKKLEKLALAAKSGKPSDIQQYQVQKAEVTRRKRELERVPKT
jgi:hypothetical protein